MWILYALLSNIAFTVQDLVAFRYTSSAALNGFAVGAGYHIIIAVVAPLINYLYSLYYRKTPSIILGAYKSVKNSSLILFIYALFLFLANGCLYVAYDLGARQNNINPGVTASLSNVSLIISTLLPVIFFNAKMSLTNVLGIIIYFVAGYFLTTPSPVQTSSHNARPESDKDVEGKQWYQWFGYSLSSGLLYGLAAFCGFILTRRTRTSAGSSLMQSYALYVSQAIISILVAIALALNPTLGTAQLVKGYNYDLYDIFTETRLGMPIFAGGLGGALGVAALFTSYSTAPNPGFADAISNLYVASTAIASWLLFKTPLSNEQVLGMILSGFSISLLST